MRSILFLILIFSAITFSLSAQQYESMRIARIDIVPANLPPDLAFDIQMVRAKMRTKVGNVFSQAEFDADLKVLADEYDRVEPIIDVVDGQIFIVLQLWLKPTIRSITFVGNERVSSKKLLKQLEIEAGSVFERDAFIQGFNKMRVLYIKKGYFESELSFELNPVDGSNDLDIVIIVNEGRAGKIKKIEFHGLTPCEESELLEIILTRRYQFLFSWYTGRGCYHPDMVEHDRLTILNYFQNKGYADVAVEICVEESPHKDRINLVVFVDKGICYTIENITLCGNTLFSKEQIYDQFLFGIGSVYSPEKLRLTVKAITDLYGSCGYIDTTVDAQFLLHDGEPIYDVCLTINEGEQYHVGLVKVFGNTCTHTSVILHENLLCPGEVFDNRKLEATELRLCGTGYFGSVNVYAVKSQFEDPCGERLYKDIYIEVEETDTGSVGLSVGFSSIDRIFGVVEVTERNFNIAGITQVFNRGPGALRGGGEFAHWKTNIGDRQTSYLIQWTKPYFMDTQWIVGFDLEKANNRAISKAYEIKTYGGNAHGTYIWNQYLKYDIHYRAKHTNVDVHDTSNAFLRKEAAISGLISAAGFSIIYDSTDHPRRPTCGLRSRFLYELAGIGGNFQFMKFSYLNSFYYPLTRRGVLKLRGDVQFIKTYGTTDPDEVPLSERFYLGGETTIRGYRPFSVGPMFGPNEPRGGLSSYLISEEYQHNLLKMPCLDGFVFCDAGYVSASEFTLGQFVASVGFGIRVEVMKNMPMMFGLGWPIHPGQKLGDQRLNNTQRFFFSMGGSF